jgi:hypothetical protein
MKKRRKGFSEIGLLFEGNQFWGTRIGTQVMMMMMIGEEGEWREGKER